MQCGWYQVAFERDLSDGLVSFECERPLIGLRTRKGLRVFDATCPHRGANLGFGGRPDGDAIVCPFHGLRIGLGSSNGSYCVAEYQTLTVGGLVFVLLSPSHDHGLRGTLEGLDRDHYVVPGFSLTVRAPAALVIENAFDVTHFRPVHDIGNAPAFTIATATSGEFAVEGVFHVPPSPWQTAQPAPGTDSVQGLIPVPYTARAFSPGIVLSRMGGDHPYYVLTAATPLTGNTSVIRLSLLVAAGPGGSAPDQQRYSYLLHQSRLGLEKDKVIWDNLTVGAPEHLNVADQSVVRFRSWLASFEMRV